MRYKKITDQEIELSEKRRLVDSMDVILPAGITMEKGDSTQKSMSNISSVQQSMSDDPSSKTELTDGSKKRQQKFNKTGDKIFSDLPEIPLITLDVNDDDDWDDAEILTANRTLFDKEISKSTEIISEYTGSNEKDELKDYEHSSTEEKESEIAITPGYNESDKSLKDGTES
eukprot:UN25263